MHNFKGIWYIFPKLEYASLTTWTSLKQAKQKNKKQTNKKKNKKPGWLNLNTFNSFITRLNAFSGEEGELGRKNYCTEQKSSLGSSYFYPALIYPDLDHYNRNLSTMSFNHSQCRQTYCSKDLTDHATPSG